MDRLSEIVKAAVLEYRADGETLRMFALMDDQQQVYTVTSVDWPVVRIAARIVVQARVVGDRVVIDADNTDRPLYKRLMARGIAREKIILAYVGETLPEAQEQAS